MGTWRSATPEEGLKAAPGPCAAGVEVKAPAAGRVLRVVHESAGPVAVGTPLVEIGDPTLSRSRPICCLERIP
jgi:hypothetical protein